MMIRLIGGGFIEQLARHRAGPTKAVLTWGSSARIHGVGGSVVVR